MTAKSENKVLYTSIDRRYNLHEMTMEPEFVTRVKKLARSVACMLFNNQLIHDATSKTYRLNNPKSFSQQLSENGWTLGEKERFSSEPVVPYGTGFLIGPDTLLTAGHCVCDVNGALDQAPKCHNHRFRLYDARLGKLSNHL